MPRSSGIGKIVAVLAATALIAWGSTASSQSEPSQPEPAREDTARKQEPGEATTSARSAPTSRDVHRETPEALVMTPGREAAALKFAQLHHPELERLLVRLERNNPAEYRRAVRKLYQDSERLARTAERAADRYDLELEAWKLDSRIRLLVARMSMSSDASSGGHKLDDQLQTLLRERVDLRLRQLQSERERLTTRLGRLNETIVEIESDPEEAALRDLQRVKRSLGMTNRPNRTLPGLGRNRSSDDPLARPDKRSKTQQTTTETER